ncbi:Uncharacterised protein [[Clostridium] sordellii]|uniref:hypothetical protein n=1 Tax=Paraclostridium sordellii TaxID=1505 RepID=UPI0005E18750|nr:hypothetical protein [Paeniclostridium sordellii]CEP45762.1 Uncharacterised protein [[Clostridium] sordellii] [Paeniclostridium sordellii]
MEKYFRIKDECRFKKDYFDYMGNSKMLNDFIKEFFDKNDIETSKYYLNEEQLYIVPTESDMCKFDKQLNKPKEKGLRAFKKNSRVNKAFVNKLKENDLKILRKPQLWMYIDFIGRMSTQTFIKNSEIYAKVETDYKFIYSTEYFEEIKASEYYKIKESI